MSALAEQVMALMRAAAHLGERMAADMIIATVEADFLRRRSRFLAEAGRLGSEIRFGRRVSDHVSQLKPALASESQLPEVPPPDPLSLPLNNPPLIPPSPPPPVLSPVPVQKRVRQRHQYSPEFQECWSAYGRGEEKAKAYDAWLAAAKTVGGETALRDLVLAALKWQAPTWAKDNWAYAPYFERYLKRRKWEDVPQKANGKQPAPQQQPSVYRVLGETNLCEPHKRDREIVRTDGPEWCEQCKRQRRNGKPAGALGDLIGDRL
ncbi:MAG TPA: hypothetical protein VD948_06275 [Rhodothermales bacterium]|nr:hypothetical protein [Rhodothermales bacterium]